MTAAAHDTKLAIVVDVDLPPGLAANTAAVLALSLGRQLESVIGPKLEDGSGGVHAGITTVPIPILVADAATVKQIRSRAVAEADARLLVIDFTDCAQRTRTYEDYAQLLEAAGEDDITYLGVAMHGPRKLVQRLTGSLPLMR
jgi:hypothetical protein